NQDFSLPYLGKFSPPKTIEEGAGNVLQTLAFAIPAGKISTGLETGLKTIPGFAAQGAAFGAGSALEQNKGFGGVVGGAITGGLTGWAADLGLRGVGKAFKYTTSRLPKFLSIITGEDTDAITIALKHPE